MSSRVELGGTSVTSLAKADADEWLRLLGQRDETGRVPIIVEDPTEGLGARIRGAGWRNATDVVPLMRTNSGPRQPAVGVRPSTRELAYLLYCGGFGFTWEYGNILTKPGERDGERGVPLTVKVIGRVRIGSIDALLARTREGLPDALVLDWGKAREMCAGPFSQNLSQRTYREHKVIGLPGRTGVSRDSQLWRELQETVDGVLGALERSGNLFSLENVRVVDVLPPQTVLMQEQAQEALVRGFGDSIASATGEPFWNIRGRIADARKSGQLDPENASRLLEQYYQRAEEALALLVQETNAPGDVRAMVQAAEIPDERKKRLYGLLDKRAAELAEKQRAADLVALRKDIQAIQLGLIAGMTDRISDSKYITPHDRIELNAELEKRRLSLEAAEVRRMIKDGELDAAEQGLALRNLPEETVSALCGEIHMERSRIKDEEESRLVGQLCERAYVCENTEDLGAVQADAGSADIANPDRRKALADVFASVRSRLEHLAQLERTQQPEHDRLAGCIPDADRGELALLSLQLERSEFVPKLKRSLEALIAARDQDLRDEVEARTQAEVKVRLAEVDVQARVVIAAAEDPDIRTRLDRAAALLGSEATWRQAAIALRAASAPVGPDRAGLLADAEAAGLFGPASRPMLGAGTAEDVAPGETQTRRGAAASDNGRGEHRAGQTPPPERRGGKRAAPTR